MSKKFQRTIEDFTCEHCGAEVSGDGYTNHCPKCLWSKHVDISPGDRAEKCQGMMKPVKLEVKTSDGIRGGRILHLCQKCGFERWNGVNKADDEDALFEFFNPT